MDDLTKHEPIKASERDRLSPVWDMSQERMFIENLLCQRFNYFLIFFSITVAGFGGAKNSIYGEVILVLGSIIIYLFSEVLHWNQKKLNAILDVKFFLYWNSPYLCIIKVKQQTKWQQSKLEQG